ncbi:MAG: energy-coupling factor transporter transmembrane component T [Christensenella sp.]
MKSINPAYKLIGVLVPIIILAFFYNITLNLVIFGASLAVLAFSKIKWSTALKLLIPVAVLTLGMYMTGMKFHSGANIGVGAGNALLSGSGVLSGLQLASRVLAFAGVGMTFVLTTNNMELMRSLEQQLHMPVKFVYGLQAAFSLLPNMQEEYRKTKAAFWARGIYPFSVSPRLLIPLMVKSVRWSEALAAAMESKGFDEKAKRTTYHPLKMRVIDYAFPFLTTGLMVLGLGLAG